MKKLPGARRDSLKNAFEAVRRFSLTRDKEDDVERRDDELLVFDSRPVYMELIPGMILEGVEVDL